MTIFRAEYTDESSVEFIIADAAVMSEEEIWITAYRMANGHAPEYAGIVSLICIAM